MTFFNESRENSFFKLSVLSEHGFFLLVSLLVRAYYTIIIGTLQPHAIAKSDKKRKNK
jgi:hypothetical protein